MRPVVVTAVLLLVVLMSMSASAAWTPELMCRTKYQATPCSRNLGKGWYQISKNAAGGITCVKAFHDKQLKFGDAEKACQQFDGGHLVSITSIAELEKVECAMYWVNTGKAHYWIGRFRKDKGFAWTDRTGNRSWAHWARGQPNSWWSEHCVEMNFGGWGLWNDLRCHYKRPYVCKVYFW